MPHFANYSYNDDFAYRPGESAAASGEIATCGDHAAQLARRQAWNASLRAIDVTDTGRAEKPRP
ncbi:hypothetical protein [Plantactinospora sp. GCM10030261]|uniref:hypothetical protein n=1 Tax=Plantactinospora sp. GCM10030261 TaxID=3273420 RepID=UPI00361FAE62